MLSHRPTTEQDLASIGNFAQTQQELYFFFPKADYPLTIEQLTKILKERTYSTTIEYIMTSLQALLIFIIGKKTDFVK